MNREEAIEVYNGLLNQKIKEAFEFFAPELAESENERIRKVIYKLMLGMREEIFTSQDEIVTKDKVLAYLEKQKEQKPVEWSKEEKDKFNSIERLIVNANAHGNYLIGDKEAIDLQHFIRSIVKPTTNLAEWNKEDEKMLEDTILIVKKRDNAYGQDTSREQDWLKDLPHRFNLQPKQEWSEEDRRIMDGIQLVLESWDRTHSSIAGLPSLIPSYISWLKARRPQSKQKRQIKEGDKVSIHCRKDRKEGIITIYDGKVGEVIHVWDAKRNPWGHIGVRLDNGCNHGFYEDELEVLDELSWKPSEVCYGAKGDPDPAGVWKPSEKQIEALEYVIRDYREDSCNATANYLQEILDHLKNV